METEVVRSIDYFEKSDYNSRELVYQALLEELCGGSWVFTATC